MVLAGGVGGIITLLGAYAVLGSGLLATLADTGPDETQAQLSELSTTVGGLSDQTTSLSESLAGLETRMTDFADQPVDTSGTEALQSDIDTLRVQIAEALATSQTNLETNSAAQSEFQETLSTLESELAALSDAMTLGNETFARELSELAMQQSALENSVAEGEAGEVPALAALETRLTSLSDQMTTQANQINTQISSLSAEIPTPVREELNTIGDMVTSLQNQLSIMETLQLTSQQQQLDLQSLTNTVEGVAGSVKRVAGKTDRLEATVSTTPEEQPDAAMDGARLAYVQDALKNAVLQGMPFAGLVTQARTLMADSGSTVELPEDFLQAARSGLTPLSDLSRQISDARSDHIAALSQATPAEQAAPTANGVTAKGLLDGIMKGAQGLVTVRNVDATGTAPPDSLPGQLRSAEAAASADDLSQLSASLDEIAGNAATSDALQQSVSFWQLQTRHHQTAAGLQDQLNALQQSIWADTSNGDPS